MNRRQNWILWIGIVVLVVLCIYPPWYRRTARFRGATVTYREQQIGRNCLWRSLPLRDIEMKGNYVDFQRLSLEMLAVVLITGGLLVTLRKGNSKAP